MRRLITDLAEVWFLGFMFSVFHKEKFLWNITIPKWLNRIFFIFKKDNSTNIFAIVWQSIWVIVLILVMIMHLFKIAWLEYIINTILNFYLFLFFITGIAIGFFNSVRLGVFMLIFQIVGSLITVYFIYFR